MTTHARSASDDPNDADEAGAHRLHPLPPVTPPPSDDLILEQIRETVRRVTAASLRSTTNRDVLISAEDIAQETMATLHVQRDREPPESLLGWALGVARLKLQAALRRSRTRGLPHALLPEALDATTRTDEQIVELMQYVWLLDHLPTLDRMIVQGRQAGFSSREIAEELRHLGYGHMTANNVDQRFYRALKTLRRLVAEEGLQKGSHP